MGALLQVALPITVEEFEKTQDPPGGRYELHHGELVFVPFPIQNHWREQRRLRRLLEPMYEPLGFIVGTEFAYRPLPQNEVWGADVVCISGQREKSIEKWLMGSPELVIEVKSPSNTKEDLHDKAMTTLAGQGAAEFWIVDQKTRTVLVHRKSGMALYQVGDSIPLPLTERALAVAEIFAE